MKNKFQLSSKTIIYTLLVVMSGFFVQKVLARSLLCNYTIPYAGRTVQSCKGVYVSLTSGGYYWQGRMTTKVINRNAVSKLGWYSWTDTRFCDGLAKNNYYLGTADAYSSKSISSTSLDHPVHPSNFPTCVGLIEARIAGNHYWEQVGYSPKTDNWEYWEPVP